MRSMTFGNVIALAVASGLAITTLSQAIAQSPLDKEHPFLAENRAAMDKMMSDMDVKPTGDVDADFAAMMIPHHQGAIDMALAELRHGSNEQLRRIAQEIVVEQQQEIIAMRLALGQPLPPDVPAPTQATPAGGATADDHAMNHHHSGASHDAMSSMQK